MARRLTDEELALLPEEQRNDILKKRERRKDPKIKQKIKEYNSSYYHSEHGNNIAKKNNKKWRENPDNKEKIILYSRNFKKTDKYKIYSKIYNYNYRNSEHGKLLQHTWKNSDHGKMKIKSWIESNRDKFKKWRSSDKGLQWYNNYKNSEHGKIIRILSTNNRRHNKNKVETSKLKLNEILFIKNKFNNQCFNCGSEKKLCLDHHYPLSKGYPLIEKNSVVLCNSCNSSKTDKMPQDFYSETKLKQLESFFDIATREEMDKYKKAI